MRELVERELVDGVIGKVRAPGRRGGVGGRKGRTVTVNAAESPLGWLAARGLVDARQHEAGERLRADYEMAALGPRVTMRWDGGPLGRGSGGQGMDASTAQISSKRRFNDALAALGGGLKDVAWRVICAGEGLPAAEKGLGWPARSGRLVLTLALDRLADHYRLP